MNAHAHRTASHRACVCVRTVAATAAALHTLNACNVSFISTRLPATLNTCYFHECLATSRENTKNVGCHVHVLFFLLESCVRVCVGRGGGRKSVLIEPHNIVSTHAQVVASYMILWNCLLIDFEYLTKWMFSAWRLIAAGFTRRGTQIQWNTTVCSNKATQPRPQQRQKKINKFMRKRQYCGLRKMNSFYLFECVHENMSEISNVKSNTFT